MSTITTNGSSDPCHDGCKRKFAVIACPSCHQLALTLVGMQTCGSDSALCHEHLNTIVQKDFFVSDVPVRICGTCQGHEVAAKGTEWSEADRKAEEKDDGEGNRGKYDLFTSDSSSEAEGSEYDRDDERYYDDESDDGYEYSDDDSAYGLRAIPEEDEDEGGNAEEGDQSLEPRTSPVIPGDDNDGDEEGETDDAVDNVDESSEPPISARNLFPPMFHEDSTQSFPYIPEGPPPLEDLIFSDDEDWNRNSTEE